MTMRFAGVALAAAMACGWASGAEAAYTAVFTYSGTAQSYDTSSGSCNTFYSCSTSGPELSFISTFTYKSDDIGSAYIFSDPRIPLYYAYSPEFTADIAISDGFEKSYSGLFTINDNEYSVFPTVVEANVDYLDVDGTAVKSPNVLVVSYLSYTGSPFRFGQNYIDAGGAGNGNGWLSVDGDYLYRLDPAGLSVHVSFVPLPASAPLFGAALLGLGALGFRMKRSAKVS